MGRTILTEEQKELIALIPKAIRNSKDFTNAAKLVLAQLDLQDGTDFSETNHYVFSSNEDLMKNTGIASKHTVINAVKKLVNEGLIETKRGYRRKGDIKASEYVLTDKYYELDGRDNPHKQGCNKGCNKNEQGCNKGCNCTNLTNTVIEDMQQQINELREEIEKLQNALKKINCTSDTETDIEIEPELEIHECSIPCTGNKLEKTNNDMKYNDEFITENDRGAWEVLSMDDNFDYTQYSDIAEMVKRDAGNKGVKNELSDFDKKNEWCTWAYDELKHLIQILYESWEPSNVLSYANKINSLFDEVDEHINQGWFTKKQIAKFDGMVNNFNSIIRKKSELMDGAGTEQSSVSNENNITSISTSESDKGGGCAAPSIEKEDCMMIMRANMTEDEIARLSKKSTKQEEKKYGDYDSVEQWLKTVNEQWGLTTQEPMVAYGNSVQEAQQQFAMALAANG